MNRPRAERGLSASARSAWWRAVLSCDWIRQAQRSGGRRFSFLPPAGGGIGMAPTPSRIEPAGVSRRGPAVVLSREEGNSASAKASFAGEPGPDRSLAQHTGWRVVHGTSCYSLARPR